MTPRHIEAFARCFRTPPALFPPGTGRGAASADCRQTRAGMCRSRRPQTCRFAFLPNLVRRIRRHSSHRSHAPPVLRRFCPMAWTPISQFLPNFSTNFSNFSSLVCISGSFPVRFVPPADTLLQIRMTKSDVFGDRFVALHRDRFGRKHLSGHSAGELGR